MAKCFIESPGMGKELINWSLQEESRAVPLDSDWDVDGEEEMVRLLVVVVLLLLVLLFGLGVMMELLEMEEEKLEVYMVVVLLLPGVLQDSKLLELVPR